jgi:hypothetical protein
MVWATASPTYITNISGNVVTLSNNLAGTVADSTALTFTPPGLWLDFSTTSNMTVGAGNKVSQITELVNGISFRKPPRANSLFSPRMP